MISKKDFVKIINMTFKSFEESWCDVYAFEPLDKNLDFSATSFIKWLKEKNKSLCDKIIRFAGENDSRFDENSVLDAMQLIEKFFCEQYDSNWNIISNKCNALFADYCIVDENLVKSICLHILKCLMYDDPCHYRPKVLKIMEDSQLIAGRKNTLKMISKNDFTKIVEMIFEDTGNTWSDTYAFMPLDENLDFSTGSFMEWLRKGNRSLYERVMRFADENDVYLDDDDEYSTVLDAIQLVEDVFNEEHDCDWGMIAEKCISLFVDYCMTDEKLVKSIGSNISIYLLSDASGSHHAQIVKILESYKNDNEESQLPTTEDQL